MSKSEAAKARSRIKEAARRKNAEATAHLYRRLPKSEFCAYCGAPSEVTNRVVSVSVAANYVEMGRIKEIENALLIVDSCRPCASTAQLLPFDSLEEKADYIGKLRRKEVPAPEGSGSAQTHAPRGS